ncbi:MAG: GtrA family protein [Veillonellales bacterium]
MIRLLIKFSLVGLAGVGINMVVYICLTALKTNYLIAAGCSFIVAVTSNFAGHVLWTFKNQAAGKSIPKKYLIFCLISAITLGMNLFFLQFLVDYIKLNIILAQLMSIGVVSGLNFILNYLVTFGETHDKHKKGGSGILWS